MIYLSLLISTFNANTSNDVHVVCIQKIPEGFKVCGLDLAHQDRNRSGLSRDGTGLSFFALYNISALFLLATHACLR